MNTRKVVMLVALLASVDGCAVDGSDASDTSDVADDSTSDGDMMNESTLASDLDAVFARHGDDRHNRLPNNVPVGDPTGVFTTVSTHGFIDLNNEFFQDLGTNGRRCVSCHVPTSGWTITPRQLQTVFDATDGGVFDDGFGLSAVFRPIDGANAPNADVSTLAKRRQAYSLLLNKGLIRIHLPLPTNAEFELVAVDDPYHFSTAADMSLYRRPPPTTNLKFDSTIMWDGRENAPGQTIAQDLANQANDAQLAHAQGMPLTQAQRESIVNFENALVSAQIFDRTAGDLHAAGARGGTGAILAQEFHIGINDNFGDPVTGQPFNPVVFNIFDRWTNIGLGNKDCDRDHDHDRDDRCRCDHDDHGRGHGHGYGRDRDDDRCRCDHDDHGRGHGYGHDRDDDRCRCDHDDHGHGHDRDCDRDDRDDGINAARRAVARGQALFNTLPITISGVSGINDEAAFGKPAKLIGTCTTCHNTPNSGNHSVAAPLNIGLVDESRRTPDLPLYTLRNKTTGEMVRVTDPGRALIDGKWDHIGRFKGPILRDLAPRAPYFHNGFAKDLDAVIDFYDERFDLKLTRQQHSDLVAFLRSL